MPNPNFAFDANTQRYRYTTGRNKGKFVSQGRVRSVLRSYLKDQAKVAKKDNDLLFTNKISLSEWENRQAKRLKSLSLQVFKIGNPNLGKSDTDFSDYGFIGSYLKQNYLHLRRLSEKIANGDLSEKQINANLDLYFNDLNYLIEESKRKSHLRNKYAWERRLLSVAEHCQDCLNYAGMGWQPIGKLPPITTQCQCKANDKCYFEYSKSLTKPQSQSILQIKQGWL